MINRRFAYGSDKRYTVDETTGCHLWEGAMSNYNKSRAYIRRDGKTWIAHRWFYLQKYGTLPDELHHTCFNSRCVNPEHLKPTTRQENLAEHGLCKIHPSDEHCARNA